MRVPCHLRQLREGLAKTLREVEMETGISRGDLSAYETGRKLVADRHELQLEEAYGAPSHEWYPPALLVLIEPDEHRTEEIADARRRARERSAA